MTSEDWKTVLLAAITMLGGVFGPAVIWMLNEARKKSNEAKDAAISMKELVNGRMDDLVAKAEAKGFAAGVASVAKAMGDNPQIPVSQRQVFQAVADASAAGELKPAVVSVVGPTGGK